MSENLPVPPAYQALIESNRVSALTRALLLARAAPPKAGPLAAGHLAMLRILVDRLLPEVGAALDIAGRVNEQLAGSEGDGWRAATLPPDLTAYRAGLDVLLAAGFAALDDDAKDALLGRVAAGDGPAGALDPAQMKAWFEDVRGDAARAYMAHPATLARIGYSGIGYGGDAERLPGFVDMGPGEREAWEPEPAR